MLKVILPATARIPPFNEPARDLRIQNAPLWLWQRNMLAPYVTKELELTHREPLPRLREPMLVHRNNLFFDRDYIKAFMTAARKRDAPAAPPFHPRIPPFVNMPCRFPHPIRWRATSILPTCGSTRAAPSRMWNRS